jgi:hypothetical protein
VPETDGKIVHKEEKHGAYLKDLLYKFSDKGHCHINQTNWFQPLKTTLFLAAQNFQRMVQNS